MKNVKKQPAKQLEKFSTIFTQLGLVLVLFVVYGILEHETKQKTLSIHDPEISKSIFIEPNTEVLFTKETTVKPKPEPLKQNQLILDEEIDKVDDDKIETTLITEPKKQTMKNTQIVNGLTGQKEHLVWAPLEKIIRHL